MRGGGNGGVKGDSGSSELGEEVSWTLCRVEG